MKNWIKFLGISSALLMSSITPSNVQADGWDAQVRVAGFAPCSKLARKVYSNVWPQFQLQFSYDICCPVGIWANVGWSPKSGKSTKFHNGTKLNWVPIGLGVDYSFDIACCVDAYVGVGATYNYLQIKNDSKYVKRTDSKWAWGGIAKTGLRYHFHESFFGELFVDYSFVDFKFKKTKYYDTHNVNLNGVLFGAGLGVSF